MSPARCLVIQHKDSEFRERVSRILPRDLAFSFEWVEWHLIGTEQLASCRADIVIAVAAPDLAPAVRLFEWLGAHPVRSPILAVLTDPIEESVIETVVKAATDFVVLPVRDEELRHRLARMITRSGGDPSAVRERLIAEAGLSHLVGADPAFTRVLAQLPRIARSEMPVLIVGETGTGKELCARAIHHLSARRNRSFVAVDCGAVPDHLFENELYGHVRGAFTDAHRDQRGLVAMAQGGTLFLDEIDALSPAAQAKLLRLLQERVYRPLGADRFVDADINVITATNRDLVACVREQRFRSDLYYRLNVLSLALPPLRERRGDIIPLAHMFLHEARLSTGTGPLTFSDAARATLMDHDWPGNVRELQNVVRRAVVACTGTDIRPGDLPVAPPTHDSAVARTHFRMARAAVLDAFERRYVEELLERHNGNVTHAAREAQKDRRAFGRLIKKYGIQKQTLVNR